MNNVMVLNREQHELMIQIQVKKTQKVLVGIRVKDLERQIQRLNAQQYQLNTIAATFLDDIIRHGNHQLEELEANSPLSDINVRANLVCCVQEMVGGRMKETDLLAEKYKNMNNDMKKRLEPEPSVRAMKECEQHLCEITAGIGKADEQNAHLMAHINEIRSDKQQFIQVLEENIRHLTGKITNTKKELQQLMFPTSQIESASQNSVTFESDAPAPNPVVSSPLKVNSRNNQIDHDLDFSLSPIKFDESVDLLSSQLSESSIRETHQATETRSSSLSNLIQHANVHNNDVFVDPSTSKRIPSKIHIPPAKKPCYGDNGSEQTEARNAEKPKKDDNDSMSMFGPGSCVDDNNTRTENFGRTPPYTPSTSHSLTERNVLNNVRVRPNGAYDQKKTASALTHHTVFKSVVPPNASSPNIQVSNQNRSDGNVHNTPKAVTATVGPKQTSTRDTLSVSYRQHNRTYGHDGRTQSNPAAKNPTNLNVFSNVPQVADFQPSKMDTAEKRSDPRSSSSSIASLLSVPPEKHETNDGSMFMNRQRHNRSFDNNDASLASMPGFDPMLGYDAVEEKQPKDKSELSNMLDFGSYAFNDHIEGASSFGYNNDSEGASNFGFNNDNEPGDMAFEDFGGFVEDFN